MKSIFISIILPTLFILIGIVAGALGVLVIQAVSANAQTPVVTEGQEGDLTLRWTCVPGRGGIGEAIRDGKVVYQSTHSARSCDGLIEQNAQPTGE